AGLLAGEPDLIDDFIRSAIQANSTRGVAGPKVTVLNILFRPPLEEGRITLFFGFDVPVKLRGEVIEPALRQPLSGIGKNLVVRIETFDLLWKTVPPNAEGPDAKLNNPFLGLARFVEP